MKKLFLTLISFLIVSNAYADIDGTYNVVGYAVKDTGNGLLFNNGKEWSSDDDNAKTWDVVVSLDDEGECTIFNLFDKGETLTGTYDSYDKTIIIPTGSLIFTDDYNYEYKICGGFKDCHSAEDIMNYSDSQTGYIESSRAPFEDIQIDVDNDGNSLSLYTPVLIYVTTPQSKTFIGYSYSILTSLELEKDVEPGVKGDMDGDNEISITDVVMICNVVLEDKYSYIADMNNDGEVTVTDVVALVNLLLND